MYILFIKRKLKTFIRVGWLRKRERERERERKRSTRNRV